MLFGAELPSAESTSNTTKVAIPLYSGAWTTRFANLMDSSKIESFPQFWDWKFKHVFLKKHHYERHFYGEKLPHLPGSPVCRDVWNKTPRMHPKKVDPPRAPKKINQMNSCHPSDNCFHRNCASPKNGLLKTYLEPQWPLFWKVNFSKQFPNSNQNTHLASRYILYIPILLVPTKETLVIMTSNWHFCVPFPKKKIWVLDKITSSRTMSCWASCSFLLSMPNASSILPHHTWVTNPGIWVCSFWFQTGFEQKKRFRCPPLLAHKWCKTQSTKTASLLSYFLKRWTYLDKSFLPWKLAFGWCDGYPSLWIRKNEPMFGWWKYCLLETRPTKQIVKTKLYSLWAVLKHNKSHVFFQKAKTNIMLEPAPPFGYPSWRSTLIPASPWDKYPWITKISMPNGFNPIPQMDSQVSPNSPNKCRVGSQVHGHREAALVNGVLNEDLLDLLI